MPEHVYISPSNKDKISKGVDSVTLRATDMYAANAYQRFFQGKKYRDAWGAAITVPVVWLDTLKGGLTPTDKGGGFQTLSLDLRDSQGYVYTIRTVAKNPVKLIKPWMKTLGIDNIVVDGISAGHPYGAMIVPPLSEAAGILHFYPKLYYVPQQPQLGKFNSEFGNKLFWLEYEPEDQVPPIFNVANAEDFDDSEKVLEKWRANPATDIPNFRALVRARIFDLWVGDWDRHDGQWGWIQYQDGGINRYYPVANDRDNVFYGVNGFFPSIIRTFEKRLQPFGAKIKSVDGLTQNSAYFDYSFLFDVDKELFIEEARSLQASLTDSLIRTSVQQWPTAIYELDGEFIVNSLIARRADLEKYAVKFHDVVKKRGVVKDEEH